MLDAGSNSGKLTHMKALVIYPQDASYTVEIHNHLLSVQNKLAYIFENCQNSISKIPRKKGAVEVLNEKPEARLRSLSVGDLVFLDGAFYFCDLIGWKGVSENQSLLVQRIPIRNRLMGWEWLAEHYPLGEAVSI